MANSNKTCRGIMAGVDKRSTEELVDASRERDPELWDIMDKVSRGELSVEEASEKIQSTQKKSQD